MCHDTEAAVIGQLVVIGSLLLSWETLELNSGHQAWWGILLPNALY